MKLTFASVVAVALLAACKGGPTSPASPSTTAPAAAASTAAASAVTPSADTTPLTVGMKAPDVSMTLHDGKVVTLASYAGKRVLVYFYPKDDTPGCTVEAQGLRDRYDDLVAAGVVVLGVSTQDAGSHEAFIAKHDLPFPLVVDTGGAIARAFRVPLRASGLAARQSFLVGKDGALEAVWLEVDPSTHAADVLAAVR